jgi:hypothetical protein
MHVLRTGEVKKEDERKEGEGEGERGGRGEGLEISSIVLVVGIG